MLVNNCFHYLFIYFYGKILNILIMEIIAISLIVLVVYSLFTNKSKVKQTKKNVSNETTYEGLSDKDLRDVDVDYKAKRTIYNKNPDAKNIPKLVKLGREIHKGKSFYNLSQEYFSKLPNSTENKYNGINLNDYNLSLIEALILYEKMTWNTFAIKKIPLIEDALMNYTFKGMTEKVKEIYELVIYFPELSMYYEEASDYLKLSNLLPTLLEYIKEKNGVKTIELKDVFEEDYELIKSKMYYLGKFGILNVSKIGNSNFYEALH